MENKKIIAVVDGEAALIAPYDIMSEKMKAVFSSNPIFIVTSEDVAEGMLWDGEKFIEAE